MSFIAGYLLGLGQGGTPTPTPSLLSLEGIKSLKTIATITVGDFVFDIKEPKLFYSGDISLSNAGAAIEIPFIFSVIVNNHVAYLGGHGSNTTDYYGWYNDSLYFRTYSDFKAIGAKIYAETTGLPTITIGCSCKYSSGYDGVVSDTGTTTASDLIRGEYISDVIFSDLGLDEYYQFVKSYAEARKANEPVVNIL